MQVLILVFSGRVQLDSTINCDDSSDCNVCCNGANSCQFGKINGPNSHDFSIDCDGGYFCHATVIKCQD